MMRCSTGDRGEVRFVGIPQGQPPVVEDDQIGLGKAGHKLGKAPIAMGQAQLLEQSGQAQIQGRVAFATGLLSQSTGDPGLAHTGCAVDDQIEPLVDPAAGGQLKHQCLVEPARCAVVQILDTGVVLELGLAQTRLQAPILAFGHLPVDEQAEALLEAKRLALGHVHLLDKRLVHAHQA
jgi:hypothetical protein